MGEYHGNTNVPKYLGVKDHVAAENCSMLVGQQKKDCDFFVQHKKVEWNNTLDGKIDLRMW